MNSILFILLGIILWQTVTFIVMLVTKEDDAAISYTGAGLPLIVFNGTMFIIKFLRKIYIRRNYIVAVIWNEKGSDGKPMRLERVRVKKGAINKYYAKGENQYYIEEFTPTWKSFENEENIKHVRKNGWYCQQWINENLVKKRCDKWI